MLDKRSKNIVFAFGLFVVVLLIAEIVRPTPIDWRPSYTALDKIPFGAHVLYKELPSLFPNATLETVTQDPFEFLQDTTAYGTNEAYLFIDTDASFDDRQQDKLKAFAAVGNTVFISSNYVSFKTNDSVYTVATTLYEPLEKEVKANLFTPSFLPDSLPKFQKGMGTSTFYELDTLQTKALGYFKFSDSDTSKDETPRDSLNFIVLQHGLGQIYFHTVPETFSNYYMLRDNDAYAASVLSYIEADKIYLDAFKKSGKRVVSSPLRFVLNQAPLKWAYYLLLAGLLVFVIFRSKREQRIIEVIKPLENTSIEFTKTIGDLYFQHKDYGNIIAKKITYFLETVRTRYFMNTSELNEEFVKRLAAKTGNPEDTTAELIRMIQQQKGKSFHTEADLIALNKQIEAFRL